MNKAKKKELTEEYIRRINGDIVWEVRHKLMEEYSVYNVNGENFRFAGLCDKACTMISDEIINRFRGRKHFDEVADNKAIPFEHSLWVDVVHGEQRHHPRIASKDWTIEHTWLEVCIDEEILLYVDATCEQFKDLYKDIEATYVSDKPPKWFYADNDNPACKVKWISGTMQNKLVPIITFFQYIVWGTISDIIHNVIELI